jgi:tRNA-Thr(GGU) m(6)t(6)A37 methyltransferase TsaA
MAEEPWMTIRKKEPARAKPGADDRRRARIRPVGVIRSTIKTRSQAPRLGSEGAPEAWLEVSQFAVKGLEGIVVGDDIIVVTWLHRARRDVLMVHPRGDRRRPLTGVFATRSPDRPNPLGLHRVKVTKIYRNRLRIGPIEAIDGTPVIDIKCVVEEADDF